MSLSDVQWRSLLGVALAGMVLMWGTNAGGGLDGPCLGGAWADSAPERSLVTGERSWWPPGIRCVLVTRNGVEQRTYPGPAVWGLAALVGVAPLALRRRSRTGSA